MGKRMLKGWQGQGVWRGVVQGRWGGWTGRRGVGRGRWGGGDGEAEKGNRGGDGEAEGGEGAKGRKKQEEGDFTDGYDGINGFKQIEMPGATETMVHSPKQSYLTICLTAQEMEGIDKLAGLSWWGGFTMVSNDSCKHMKCLGGM